LAAAQLVSNSSGDARAQAHNIEDISREAGGLELSAPQLIEARGRFLAAVEARVLPEVHRSLGLALDRIVNWLVDSANSTQVRKHTHDKCVVRPALAIRVVMFALACPHTPSEPARAEASMTSRATARLGWYNVASSGALHPSG
jgi:hypothetical protein